MTVFSRIDRT